MNRGGDKEFITIIIYSKVYNRELHMSVNGNFLMYYISNYLVKRIQNILSRAKPTL